MKEAQDFGILIPVCIFKGLSNFQKITIQFRTQIQISLHDHHHVIDIITPTPGAQLESSVSVSWRGVISRIPANRPYVVSKFTCKVANVKTNSIVH